MGCNSITPVIEKEYIMNFLVEEINETDKLYLSISGLITWSAYYYDRVKLKELNSEMDILLCGTIIKPDKNGSGTFNIKIPINENINIVYFGRNKYKIWNRNKKYINIINDIF
jgi:hypothetical protein